MRRPVLGTLIALACVSILPVPAAHAITLTNHVVIPHGVTHAAEKHEVVVTKVAPADSDDDGYADPADQCPHTASTVNDGCPLPPPEPAPAPVESVSTYSTAPAPAPVSSGGCPSYMSGEATSPSAVNPTSGATGCFQILPSTHDALGCTDYGTGCAAKVCAAQGNDAWVAADPCGYLGRP